MTLRITQGIKKTVKFGQTYHYCKSRCSIVFYERQQTYRAYRKDRSQLMNSLKICLITETKFFYASELVHMKDPAFN